MHRVARQVTSCDVDEGLARFAPRSTWVGTSIADRSIAADVGFRYADADTFFSG
jgi:hypothetical protein